MPSPRVAPPLVGVLAALLPILAIGCSDGNGGGVTDPPGGNPPGNPPSSPPSIAISLDPSTLTVARGGKASATVRITRSNFTGAVGLSLSGAVTGMAAAVSPATVTGDSAALTVDVAASGAPGNYTLLLVAAAAGVQSRTATLPVQVSAATAASAFKATSIAAGLAHTCAVQAGGAAFCWGAGGNFQLGDGGGADRLLPTPVAGGVAFARIAAAVKHTCGVAADGKAWCWGGNFSGQLGDGTRQNRLVPTAVTAGLSFRQVVSATGNPETTCGVTTDDEVYCWGDLFYVGPYDNDRTVAAPRRSAGGAAFASIGIGDTHGCGLDAGGAAFCWGFNTFGQLGNAGAQTGYVPSPVNGGHTFTQLAIGLRHSCGLTAQGRAFCWGLNLAGQLGDGSTSQRLVPVEVSGGHAFVSIAAGSETTCALTAGGTAWCWGRGGEGQLGAGSSVTASSTPVAVAGGITFRQLAVGSGHTCGVATDDSVYCWGLNTSGQLGDGTTSQFPVPIPVPVGGPS
jgi:alpha-tubulin suppressor-like RCC1 family protein